MDTALIATGVVILILLVLLFMTVKVAREYERGVIFRLGKLLPKPKGPGVILVFVMRRRERQTVEWWDQVES